MLAHDVLRAAAKIVDAGWSEGKEPARDASGRPVPLYSGAGGGTSRAVLNPAATRFSAYGAVAAVLAKQSVSGAPYMWGKLADAARAASAGRTGHVHPLIGYNAEEGRTADEVSALLRAVADELDPAKQAVDAGRAT